MKKIYTLIMLLAAMASAHAIEESAVTVKAFGTIVDADKGNHSFFFSIVEPLSASCRHGIISGDLSESGGQAAFEVIRDAKKDGTLLKIQYVHSTVDPLNPWGPECLLSMVVIQ